MLARRLANNPAMAAGWGGQVFSLQLQMGNEIENAVGSRLWTVATADGQKNKNKSRPDQTRPARMEIEFGFVGQRMELSVGIPGDGYLDPLATPDACQWHES